MNKTVVIHNDNMLTLENPGCYILPGFMGTFPISSDRCNKNYKEMEIPSGPGCINIKTQKIADDELLSVRNVSSVRYALWKRRRRQNV